MNKAELIKELASTSGESQARCAKVLDAIMNVVTEALAAHEKVSLTGFGNFSVKKRAARVGRNPKTNEEVKIPAKMIPFFTPGQAMRDAVK